MNYRQQNSDLRRQDIEPEIFSKVFAVRYIRELTASRVYPISLHVGTERSMDIC